MLDPPAGRPVAGGDGGMVDPGQPGPRVLPRVVRHLQVALDRLLDGQVTAVVQHHDDERDLLLHRGPDRLHRELVAAVADHGEHRPVRAAQAGADRRRDSPAERAARAAQQRLPVTDVKVAQQPPGRAHPLVDHDRLRRQHLVQLGGDRFHRHRLRVGGAFGLALAFPVRPQRGDPLTAGSGHGRVDGPVKVRRQGTQGRRRCADEPDRRGQLPANLGRVRVQVHQPGAGRQPRMADRRERVEHPGADGEHEVAAFEDGRVLAVQAEEPRIGGRERQIRQIGEVGADERRRQPVGQFPQLRNAPARLAAHHHDGPAGGGELGRRGGAHRLVGHRLAASPARP